MRQSRLRSLLSDKLSSLTLFQDLFSFFFCWWCRGNSCVTSHLLLNSIGGNTKIVSNQVRKMSLCSCLVLSHFVSDLGSPTGIRFSDVTDTSATVHWIVPKARVDGYRVIYVPADGGLFLCGPVLLSFNGSTRRESAAKRKRKEKSGVTQPPVWINIKTTQGQR